MEKISRHFLFAKNIQDGCNFPAKRISAHHKKVEALNKCCANFKNRYINAKENGISQKGRVLQISTIRFLWKIF